jgi:hypothetical protein
MLLKPDGKIDLRHRAYFLCGAPHQSLVVAATEEGQLSVLSTDLRKVQHLRLRSMIRAVSPHPSDRQLAVVGNDAGSLIVQNLDGKRLLEIAPPQFDEDAPNWIMPALAGGSVLRSRSW